MAKKKLKLTTPTPAKGDTYPLFEVVKDTIFAHHADDLQGLADDAGVSKQTLLNWLEGRTRSPQIRTLTWVALAMGYEIVLRPLGQPPLRSVK